MNSEVYEITCTVLEHLRKALAVQVDFVFEEEVLKRLRLLAFQLHKNLLIRLEVRQNATR